MDIESARLLSAYAKGADTAATEIFNRYTVRLIALAQTQLSPVLQRRVDPEDIVQSAYRSFFRQARSGEIDLKRNGDLWRILAAFALNKARGRVEMELAQKRDPRREANGSTWMEAMAGDPTPEQTAILIDQLTTFMESLDARSRRILELRLRGESIDEIVQLLAAPDAESANVPQTVSSATIRRVLRSARQALEKALLES